MRYTLFVLLCSILGALVLGGADGGGCQAAREIVVSGAEGAVQGAVTGGGWMGAVVGLLTGLVGGGAAALQQRNAKRKAQGGLRIYDKLGAHVVDGVSEFLSSALQPQDFAGLGPEDAYELAKERLREELSRAMDDESKLTVRAKKQERAR